MPTRSTTLRARPVAIGLGVVFTLGLVVGVVTFTGRDQGPVVHEPSTSAWPVHIVLTVLALAWIAVGVATRGRQRWLTPVNPVGVPIGIRIRLLAGLPLRTDAARMAIVAMMLLVIAFATFRGGQQIIGGLDPHFTANAWGGPTYLGALYCHYLDLGLMIAVAGVILNLELPRYVLATQQAPGGRDDH
ncbi:hypothetical protein [Gordonia soli]|uniref:Uncharacterized protein n=1 Tax=Gordonia soli NBRC 108243 TaxID=1223545 RepID=M0QLJ6_9ACTN|nr:hypothetical protein [Gordonia soli]GAC69181.1 hypothetical protein GS4_22_00130 [Gordonia soli NBRC 108243]